MTLSVSIAPEIEQRLRERARASGRDVAEYAAELIRQGVTAPTVDEILAPVQEDFARSRMSDDEIMELGRRELDALRAGRQSKPV